MKISRCTLKFLKGRAVMEVKDVICGGDTMQEIIERQENSKRGLRHLTLPQREGWVLVSAVITKEISETNGS